MTPPEEHKVYSISTLSLLIFKSLRTERNMTQAYIADQLGITTSGWTKIENGQTVLTMDVFFQVCEILQVRASQVTSMIEHIAFFMFRAGFLPRAVDSKKDDLLPMVRDYFGKNMVVAWNPSPGVWAYNSIMSNWPMSGDLPDVIRYLTTPEDQR
jgi:transcriptional regulator with XRE-family HTH domain